MEEKTWITKAAWLIILLGILNFFGMLRPIWLLAATIFSFYLLFHDWLANKITNKANGHNGDLLLLFVLLLFLAGFGYLAINTGIDDALKYSENFVGRINDTLAMIVLGITLRLYIRK
ncbi:hypothetical protein CEH05_20005 [Halobacillus halophilus]|uniref:hypothetical protein n=1 Tax=Halobacillus halophilus TaxID=1570 RepID=UPI0005A130FE|nr:hypothetical protein [Halobacillus halophilus]ASF41325.1 hypothetical protein CEH05_20005 [Halobacillus halophilus]